MDSQNSKLDIVLWTAFFLLLILGIGGHYYLTDTSLLLRTLGLLAACGGAVYAAYRTHLGQKGWAYWQEVLIEIRKVVWPTKKETVQTTIAVLTMVFVMGLFLWTLDAILMRVVAWLMGHAGG